MPLLSKSPSAAVKDNPRGRYGNLFRRLFPVVAFTSLFVAVCFVLNILTGYNQASSSSSSSSNVDSVEHLMMASPKSNQHISQQKQATPTPKSIQAQTNNIAEPDTNAASAPSAALTCPYMSLQDLTANERYPHATPSRHMVDPPLGGLHTLVCCTTTKGPWNILVHNKWAPNGANRFLDMVKTEYFNNGGGVPLMRCVHNFLCQFGLAGSKSKIYTSQKNLVDDANWLPEGPDHRWNEHDVKRFSKGYFAYAGSGINSRDVQLIVALQDQPRLAGGSPWEVPWGELVGNHSFATLSQIYTGYGENGPKQGSLHADAGMDKAKQEFPLLDYVTRCVLVDEHDDGDDN